MRPFPFRKYQDFYLRLGLLKILVAALPADRRSVSADAVERRLLWAVYRLKNRPPANAPDASKQQEKARMAELLDHPAIASTLYAVTGKTIYKIMDWGHDVDLVLRGNQLTERALLLRHFFPQPACDQFMAGESSDWNPFLLTSEERALLLYHLTELDQVTLSIIGRLAEYEPGTTLEVHDAAEVTCRAMFEVLEGARPNLPPSQLPEFRTAFELAGTIAEELQLDDLATRAPTKARLPKPAKSIPRTGGPPRRDGPARRTTKNSDHQTVPRFEQLADLGFVRKWEGETKDDIQTERDVRDRWRYTVTDACKRFHDARTASEGNQDGHWAWRRFSIAVASILHPAPRALNNEELVEAIWDGFQAVKRPIGHTPLDTVSLYTSITYAVRGLVIEQARIHALMLALKQKSLLPEHAFFASGNDLDRMFILLKPGFVERAKAILPKLLEGDGR